MKKFCTAVVLAAGRGSRMGTAVAKQYLTLGDKPVVVYSLAVSYTHLTLPTICSV